jgi:hypothetical protein
MLEDRVHLPAHRGPHPLGAAVVGVAKAARQGERAEQDAAFHLAAEALASRRRQHVVHRRCLVFGAQAVPHAVVAGEVGRRLARGHDVVDRDGVPGQRQGDVDRPGAVLDEERFRPLDGGRDLGREAVAEELAREADAQALDRSGRAQ